MSLRLAALGLVLGLLVLLVAVAFRPTPLAGFDGDDLAASVNGGGPFSGSYERCKAIDAGRWSCSVTDKEGSSSVNYTVSDPNWWGCWTAERAGSGSDLVGGLPKSLEGCITLFDHR